MCFDILLEFELGNKNWLASMVSVLGIVGGFERMIGVIMPHRQRYHLLTFAFP
jgi:hypothetical protein